MPAVDGDAEFEKLTRHHAVKLIPTVNCSVEESGLAVGEVSDGGTDSALDASAAASPLPPAAAAFAVSLELPDFWLHDPPSWFVHVEAQFALRGISADDTKYHQVVASLDPLATRRALTLLRDPPARGKYAALKELLLRRYALSDAERTEKLLSLSGLGGGTALELMERMLSFLGPDDGGFLFAHIFLRQLPVAVRAGLANSPLLGTKDYRSLAEDADRILLATRAFHDHDLVPASPAAPSTSPLTCPDVSAPSLAAKAQRHRGRDLCFYHQRFGPRARCCLLPYFDAMAADQRADPDVLALRSEQTGLVLEDRPVWNGGPSLLCDVSTGRPCPVVPLSWRRRVFDSIHALSHPGVRASVKLVSSRHDAHRPPLRPLYDGSFRVIQPGRKHFLLDFGGRQETLSIDRLKPAHVLQDDQLVPAQAPRRGRPPSTGLDNPASSSGSTPHLAGPELSSASPCRPCQPGPQARFPSASSPPPRFSRSGRLIKARVLD
ncbi:unnamed protein product [Oreochromis niloticus]|nr:unnamed protein product [Mustela putorius furo]